MQTTDTIRDILRNYEGETPGVKANLARMLMAGRLGGTGKMIILPVDQGFEHGPARSFAPNPEGYDPHYHYQLAIDAGLNAYAAPLGMIEAGADTFAGQIPTILKVNSANSLMSDTAGKNQAVTVAEDQRTEVGKNIIVKAGDSITFTCGKANFQMKKDGTIVIEGKDVTIKGSGKINVKASSDVTVKGSKIDLN